MSNTSLDVVARPAHGDVTALMGKAEDMVLDAVAHNDPTSVFEEIAFLRRDVQLKGVVVAKLLSDLWDKWPDLKGVDTSFDGFVEAASVGTGLAARTGFSAAVLIAFGIAFSIVFCFAIQRHPIH